METGDRNGCAAISRAELPAAITTYLAAHQARDGETAIGVFAADAVVTDEGRTHRGRDAIRAWLDGAASEYTYTTAFVGATRTGDGRYDVVQHLEGDFPGGVVDLHFRFTVNGGAITGLVIEP